MKLIKKLKEIYGDVVGTDKHYALREQLIAEGAYCRFDTNQAIAQARLKQAKENLGRLHQALEYVPGERARQAKEKVALAYAKIGGLLNTWGELLPFTEREIFELVVGDESLISEFIETAQGTEAEGTEAVEARCERCMFTPANCRCGKEDTDGAVVHEAR